MNIQTSTCDYDKGDAPFVEDTSPIYPLFTVEEEVAFNNRFRERYGRDFMADLEQQLAKVFEPSMEDIAAEFEKALMELNNEPTPSPNAVLTSANIQVSDITIREYNNEVQEVEWDSLKAAQHYYASGLCPMPCTMGKAPMVKEWDEFCHPNYATPKHHSVQEGELRQPAWFGSWRDTKQVGIVLGRASGGLQVIDVESDGAYRELISSTQGTLAGEVIERCPVSRSPNGGAHILLFHPDDYPVGPKEVLAKAAAIVEGKNSPTLIESLGEGEQAVFPTNPIAPETCKQPYMKGKRYWMRAPQRYENRYVCTREEILAVEEACRELTEVPLKTPKVELGTTLRTTQGSASTNSVFIRFNCSKDNQELALDLIYKAGWTYNHTDGDKIHLTRPDKTGGTSATWGCTNEEHGYPYFYVFSTSAEGWEYNRPYSPWDVVQKLKYNDDMEKMLEAMRICDLRHLESQIENNSEFIYEPDKAEATPALTKVASEKDINKFKSKVEKFKFADKKVGSPDGGMSKLVRMGKQNYALNWEQFIPIIAEWNSKSQSNWPEDVIRSLWNTTQVDAEQHGSALEKVPSLKLKTKKLSEFDIEPTNWIIKDKHGGGLLVAGLSMLVGQSGLGKSTLTRYIAASVTNGGKDGKIIVDEGDVLFLCFEDSVSETILPHVICCGGNPDRIHIVDGCVGEDGKEVAWNATMMKEVKEYLATHPSIKLVIIDVLTSLTAGTKASTNDADQTRAILEPLNKMGQEHGVAILTLHHPNKHGTNARAAISGSNQLTATARVVWLLGKGEDGEVRQLAAAKANYNKISSGLAFRHRLVPRSEVESMADKYGKRIPASIPDDEFNTVEIIDYHVASADDLVRNSTEPVSTHDRCTKWLLAHLAGGERKLSAILEQECIDAGFTSIALRRSRKELSDLGELETFREDAKWYVRLRE